MEKCIDLHEVAKRCKVSYSTAWRWATNGIIRAARIGGRFRVPVAAVNDLLKPLRSKGE